MNWRMLIALVACAFGAVLWREHDDRRDRRKARARAEQERQVSDAMQTSAWQENAAFDEVAARRRAELERAARLSPRNDRRSKRAA